MLRPFDPRQLGLWADPSELIVYAVMGNRYAGPTVLVHTPTLMRRLTELSKTVKTAVFLDEPFPTRTTLERVDQMLDQYSARELDALAGYVGATEALKRIHVDEVLSGVDRSTVISVASPLIISREKLKQALETNSVLPTWSCPFLLVAHAGGKAAVFEETFESSRR